jgi:hypothetical protein
MLWSIFLHNLALFWIKTPIFHNFFGENVFKIITSVPGPCQKSFNRFVFQPNSVSNCFKNRGPKNFHNFPTLSLSHPYISFRRLIQRFLQPGLPEFSWHNIPKRWKRYQIITTLPNEHKVYQMAVKCSKLP